MQEPNSSTGEAELWAKVELMGHVTLAGRLSEVERFGTKLGRVDIPTAEGGFITQFFGGSSVYRITPVAEAVARDIARRIAPAPVSPWDYPQQLPAAALRARPEPDPDEDEDDNRELDDEF